MKKLLFVFALTILLIGCRMPQPKPIETNSEKAVNGWVSLTGATQYRVITVDGHDYLVFRDINHYSIAVVHSESCKCKEK